MRACTVQLYFCSFVIDVYGINVFAVYGSFGVCALKLSHTPLRMNRRKKDSNIQSLSNITKNINDPPRWISQNKNSLDEEKKIVFFLRIIILSSVVVLRELCVLVRVCECL